MALRAMRLIFSENNHSIRFSGNLYKQFPIEKGCIHSVSADQKTESGPQPFLFYTLTSAVLSQAVCLLFSKNQAFIGLQHDFALHPGSIGHSRIGIGKLRLRFRSVEILKEPEVPFPLPADAVTP